MKKRLVISIYDDMNNPDYGGGGARVVQELVKGLSRDYSITLLTGKYPGYRDYIDSSVLHRHIGTLRFGPRINQFFFHFCLWYYAKKLSYDIWVESFTPPFSTSFLPLFTRKPVVGLVQMLSGKEMHRKYGIPFEWIEMLGLKVYSRFCIISPFLENEIRRSNKKAEIQLIQNGIDLQVERPEEQQSEPYILYLGRIEVSQKGLDLLLNAFARSEAQKSYKLYIAGSGTSREESKLKEIIVAKKLEERVVLCGRVEGVQKDRLYRHASFVVLPSRFETFGLVALEALSYGKPVIHFDLSSLEWIPQSASKSVASFSVEQFAKTLDELLQNPELRLQMSKAAVDYCKDYSWEKVLERYKNYFSTIS